MSVLRRENKSDICEMIRRLVKLYTPQNRYDLGGYVDELMTFIMSKDYIFQDKYNFDSLSELNKRRKIPENLLDRGRINLRDLHRNDIAWIRDTIKYYAIKLRTNQPIGAKKRSNIRKVDDKTYLNQHEQIVDPNDQQWVNWGSHECVFSGILIALGMRFSCVGKDQQNKANIARIEQTIHSDLAESLGLPRRTVADESLVYLLEERFGWRRLPIGTVGQFTARSQSGRSYILSYCENAQTDFWHVIFVKRENNAMTIIDRQWERKFGNARQGLPGDPATEANAWEINANAPLCQTLKDDMQINTLTRTHNNHLG